MHQQIVNCMNLDEWESSQVFIIFEAAFGQPSIFGENNYSEPISVKDPFLGKVATGKGPFLSQESSPCNWERFQQFLEQFLSQERILS